MTVAATLHRLEIALSDVDRGVYQELDLRLAQHPSETVRFLYTRALAYALWFEEGIAFGKGLSTANEPAVWVRDVGGEVRRWIEVGLPSAERLHKANKKAEQVVVFTQHDPQILLRSLSGATIFQRETIVGNAVDPGFVDELASHSSRKARWDVVRTGGEVYVTLAGRTIAGRVSAFQLGESSVLKGGLST
jgi:uncharacterized protein YaeQ